MPILNYFNTINILSVDLNLGFDEIIYYQIGFLVKDFEGHNWVIIN